MGISVFDMQALQHNWSTEETRAIFDEPMRVRKWMEVEAALARAQAGLGIIPQAAADEIVARARGETIDIPRMAAEIRRVKHALVPALKQLQAACLEEHGQWVHYGATTQDVIDTGMVLQIRDAHALFLRDLKATARELARLAREHRDTIMAGRTHGVLALPITFGHKCAIWLDELSRHHERLKQAEPRLLVGELVGAVGTQASLGPKARQVEEATMALLGLGVPDISWAPARDRFAEYAGILSMIGATIGKIGNELFNMQRNEFAEVEEGFTEGKLGSSTMPHKRNPVFAENLPCVARGLRASATIASCIRPAEGERDGIGWKTEWKAMPECCLMAGALLFQCASLLKGLRVDKARMLENLDRMRGYLLSERVMLELGEKVGKQNAHEWIYEASMHGLENRLDFADAMRRHPHISKAATDDEITGMTDPRGYLGEAGASVDRVLARTAAWLAA